MSKAPAEASNIGIASDVSQQQGLATTGLARFKTPREIRMKQVHAEEAVESVANSPPSGSVDCFTRASGALTKLSSTKPQIVLGRIVLGRKAFHRGHSMKRNPKLSPREAGRDQADYRTGSNAPNEARSLERALGAKIRAIRREREL